MALFSDDDASQYQIRSSKNMTYKVRGDMKKLLPVTTFLLGAALTAALVFLNATLDVNWRPSALASWGNSAQPDPNPKTKALTELAELLKNASMEDGTVIMTSINKAYAAQGPSWTSSWRASGWARARRTCWTTSSSWPSTPALSGVAADHPGARLQLPLHGHRHHVVPEPAAAHRHHVGRGDRERLLQQGPGGMGNRPNGGFLYVRSANRTVEFYRRWRRARRRFPDGTNEQEILGRAQGELSRRSGVRMQFLDTAHCGGFCQLSGDMGRVCTLHANCCTGLANKVHDLRNVLRDWRNYTAAPPQERRVGDFRWTRPGKCIR
ncbi:hypothetical protein ZWY2020_025311 [Hordeum vulgare]|nr:hypothetical protein ZWY2020_025311 [Hordeum vulgare]